MYPPNWHQIYGNKTGQSAKRILPPLLNQFKARSLVEVGCGNAHWTQVAIDNGIEKFAVVDGHWNDRHALLVDPERFIETDLGEPLQLQTRFDMAVCLEVAEHVPATSAAILVRSLCQASDVVLFGAAIPLQGGYGHINEQWPSYWRGLFAGEGYVPYDLVRPVHWGDQEIHYWYRQNAFVYVNVANEAAIRNAEAEASLSPPIMFDAVHPEKFEEVASYRSIAFKRLIRRLPSWFRLRLRQKRTGEG